MSGPASDWTPERIAKLSLLHAQGISFRQIAAALGGVSKSACIGKSKNLKLENRRGVAPPKRHNDMVMAPPRPPAPTPQNEPKPIGPLRDLPVRGCKFIRAEMTGAWRCCGAETIRAGIPWCRYHYRLVYQPAQKRRA